MTERVGNPRCTSGTAETTLERDRVKLTGTATPSRTWAELGNESNTVVGVYVCLITALVGLW